MKVRVLIEVAEGTWIEIDKNDDPIEAIKKYKEKHRKWKKRRK